MNVNYKSTAAWARVSEFTAGIVPAGSGDALGRHRADKAVVSGCRCLALTRFVGVILILMALGAPVLAPAAILPPVQNVTLGWDKSTDLLVAGYHVYYGGASRTYTNMVNAGNATNVTILGMLEGANYFFAATAYNLLGLESGFSEEISYTVPAVPATLQIRVAPNQQAIVTVTGAVGRTYNIQASSDFTTWSGIGSVMVPAGGSLDFTDTNAPSFPKRFYRTQ